MKDWPVFALRDISEIVAGITLGRKTKETELTEVPYMRVANVKDGMLDFSEVKTVLAAAREIKKWALQDGDLLLTEGGDLDKLGRGACWRNQLSLCIHQNHIFRVRLPTDRYDPDFVSYQVGSAYGKAYFLAHAKKTTGIASINQGVLGAFPLISPPLSEQRQIAARLKAQLAEVETARQAVRVQLLDAVLLRRRVVDTVFDDYQDWQPISAIAKVQSGYAFKSTDFKTSGVRLLRNTNILPGKVYWDDAVYLDGNEVDRYPGYALEQGDVLISLDRPLISSGIKVARVSKNDLPALLLQRVGRFFLQQERITPDFLFAFLQSSRFIKAISGHDQSLGVPHISPGQVEAVELPRLSVDDQQPIAARLKSQLAEVDILHAALTEQQRGLDALPQRLLDQAFDTKVQP